MNFPDFCCYFNKLKVQQSGLEKNEIEFIKYIKTNCDLVAETEYNQLKLSREQEFRKLKKDVQHNMKSLKSVKLLLDENLENLDISRLKNTMVSLENNIQDIKFHINSELDNFIKTEYDLSTELCVIEMKLLDLKKNIGEFNKTSVYSTKNIRDDTNIYEEVQEFAVFLNKWGGHEGGWSNDDHLIFTKIFNKHKNKNKVVQILHTLLPDISEDDIKKHFEWYKTYLELRSKQKYAIEKWRQKKNPEVTKLENQKTKVNIDKKKIIKTLREEEENDLKVKLQQWKAEKQQKLQETQEMLQSSETKLKQKDKQRRVKYQDVKREIEKWKLNKRVKEKAAQLEKEIVTLQERERRNALANKLIREFQSQDTFFIKRRLAQLKSNVTVPITLSRGDKRKDNARDPDRLFKATQQWISRITPDDNERVENTFGGYVPLRHIPKLYYIEIGNKRRYQIGVEK